MDPEILLGVVGCIALLIIVGTALAAIRVLRQPESGASSTSMSISDDSLALDDVKMEPSTSSMGETSQSTSSEDMTAFLEQVNLSDFELQHLSNSFKGTSQEGERNGLVLHIDDSEIGLIAFTSQAFNPQNGVVKAETTYGNMELIVTQGRAGVKWNEQPLGILDYTNQRILGPEGQLLGSMERPALGSETGSYPVEFFGQKAADVTTQVNAVGTLRWFGDESSEKIPAFENLAADLEDSHTLLLLSILLLEVGFMDLIK